MNVTPGPSSRPASASLDLNAAAREAGIQKGAGVRLFIVRNGKLTVPWQLVSHSDSTWQRL